jgi:hypothetical protein
MTTARTSNTAHQDDAKPKLMNVIKKCFHCQQVVSSLVSSLKLPEFLYRVDPRTEGGLALMSFRFPYRFVYSCCIKEEKMRRQSSGVYSNKVQMLDVMLHIHGKYQCVEEEFIVHGSCH